MLVCFNAAIKFNYFKSTWKAGSEIHLGKFLMLLLISQEV